MCMAKQMVIMHQHWLHESKVGVGGWQSACSLQFSKASACRRKGSGLLQESGGSKAIPSKHERLFSWKLASLHAFN